MVTKEKLAVMMADRAKKQFARDIDRLGCIVSKNGGSLSAGDMQKILLETAKNKVGIIGRFFHKAENKEFSEVQDDKYYLMQLAFRLMDLKASTTITLNDLKPEDLRSVYMTHFKKEYEEYERYQYQTRDMELAKRVLSAIGKQNQSCADEDFEII